MRNSNREIKDKAGVEAVLASAQYMTLALCGEMGPYSVPVNYGYDDGVIYFHSSKKGVKAGMLAANGHVSFSVVAASGVERGEKACKWSVNYESVIGFGMARSLESREEKIAGLKALMAHFGEKEPVFEEKVLDITAVWAIDIQSMTGKRR